MAQMTSAGHLQRQQDELKGPGRRALADRRAHCHRWEGRPKTLIALPLPGDPVSIIAPWSELWAETMAVLTDRSRVLVSTISWRMFVLLNVMFPSGNASDRGRR